MKHSRQFEYACAPARIENNRLSEKSIALTLISADRR